MALATKGGMVVRVTPLPSVMKSIAASTPPHSRGAPTNDYTASGTFDRAQPEDIDPVSMRTSGCGTGVGAIGLRKALAVHSMEFHDC